MKKIILIFSSLFIFAASFGQLNVIPIGSSGDVFSVLLGTATNLWYDSVLNTVAFFHRSMVGVNGSTTIGDIRYDYSVDGGVTWPVSQLDQGPIYRDTTNGGGTRGRYPQGVIYNPSGNTTVGGAYATVFGPITDGSIWQSIYEATLPIGTTANKEHFYYCDSNLLQLIPNGFQVVKQTGTVWGASENINSCGLAAPVFNDTIVLSKGIFNSTTHHVDYTFSQLPVNLTYDTIYGGFLYSGHNMAWNDNGQIGYVVVLGNDENPLVDSVYYPIVYKTSDGGNTWTKKTIYKQNMNLNLLHSQLPNAGDTLTTSYDVDCAVDKNNNLHIAVAVGGYAGAFSIDTTYSSFGIFDIYTTDGGNTWCGQLAALPETYLCTFGTSVTVTEDNRAQVSRSWDGSKIFVTWFDTDTATYGAGNCNPDMHSIGYDVENDLWTDAINLTTGTDADGLCTFGCVSYYIIQKGADYCIPAVFAQLQSPTSIGSQVSYSYLDGACMSNFHRPSSCVTLLSVAEISANNSFIKIYPNPLTSSSILELSATVNNAEVIIYDMVGKELLTKQLTGNKTEIERGALESGVYIVRVKVGEREYVEKLIVE